MNLMKSLGLMLVTISGATVAIRKYLLGKRRIYFLSDFLDLLRRIRSEVEYSGSTLTEILRACNSKLAMVLLEGLNSDKEFGAVLKDISRRYSSDDYDRKSFLDFWQSFGRSDAITQCSIIDLAIERTSTSLKEAEAELIGKIRAESVMCIFITIAADIFLL